VVDTFLFRPAIPEDEPFLWEMLYQAIYVPPGAPPAPRAIIQDPDIAVYVQDWGRVGDEGLVAVEQATGIAVGAAWLRCWSGEHQGYGYVDDQTPEVSIALLPGYRQHGLGTQLLTALINQASERYQAISLSVVESSPAVHLYRRLGFEVVGRVMESHVMLKRLRREFTGIAKAAAGPEK
jgi:ribosomal protein S18 acetylase RimI-like enzyme